MACTRDRIIDFVEKQGIIVKIGKNKAQGNKGFFKAFKNSYRIDVSKELDEASVLRVLTHEFIHYLHYKYDNKMESYSFLFDDINNDIIEELIKLTVDSISKEDIKPLMSKQAELKKDISYLVNCLKAMYPDFKANVKYRKLESRVPFNQKYLLKYDRVRILQGFFIKTYNIDDIDSYGLSEDLTYYIKLKSRQRNYRKVSSKISKLNRYYNKPAELLARSFERFIFDSDYVQKKAPLVYKNYNNVLESYKYPVLCDFVSLIR